MLTEKVPFQYLKLSKPRTYSTILQKSTKSQYLTSVKSICNKRTLQVKLPSTHKSFNDDFLMKRKENHIISKYNKRKKQLQQITKQNRKIYNRITSQSSHYSRNSSRSSLRSSRSSTKNESISNLVKDSRKSQQSPKPNQALGLKNNLGTHKPAQYITIDTESIAKAKQQYIKRFQSLFAQPKKQNMKINTSFNKKSKIQTKQSISRRQNYPNILQKHNDPLLKRIAEEMDIIYNPVINVKRRKLKNYCL